MTTQFYEVWRVDNHNRRRLVFCGALASAKRFMRMRKNTEGGVNATYELKLAPFGASSYKREHKYRSH